MGGITSALTPPEVKARMEAQRLAEDAKRQKERAKEQAAEAKEDAAREKRAIAQAAEDAKPKLEVLDAKVRNEQYARYIQGTVKNNTNRNYGYAQVEINLLGADGTIVGSTMANVNNLGPGQKWRFKALVTADDARKFEIKDVTGF